MLKMTKLNYSFALSIISCREMIESSIENPISNAHSRYLVDDLQYFKNGILENERTYQHAFINFILFINKFYQLSLISIINIGTRRRDTLKYLSIYFILDVILRSDILHLF